MLDATLTGDVKLAEDKMPLNLQLKAKKGQYAFTDSLAPLKINDVDIKLTGDLLNYHAEVVGGVEGMDHIPHTHVDLNAAITRRSHQRIKTCCPRWYGTFNGFIKLERWRAMGCDR